jgi:hypothetical protein
MSDRIGSAQGFNLDDAITKLTDWLVREGVVALGTPPLAAAMVHIMMHEREGESSVEQLASAPCCHHPCPRLGVSWALYACCMHQHERDLFGPWLALALQSEESTKNLLIEHSLLADASAKVRDASQALHENERAARAERDIHPHDLMCERPARLVARLRDLIDEVTTLAIELRKRALVPEFRQPPPPHRPPLALLTAVWQHLHRDGGLSFDVIATLVPDDLGPAGLMRRIKNRVERCDDERWLSIGVAKKSTPAD